MPSGIELADHIRERVEQAEVGRPPAPGSWRTTSNSMSSPARSCSSRDQLLGREARQRAAVELELDLARDHVDLLAAATIVGADGVAQQRLELRGRARRAGAGRSVRRGSSSERRSTRLVPRQLGGDPLDHLAHDGRDVHRQPLAVEVGEQAAEPRHRCRRG